ncbi:MAG: tetratricopeptide repeat protein [Verrucomicrobiia bacterium]
MNPEPSESTWFYEALAWLELNRKQVIAGGLLVFATIVAGYVYDWHRKTTQREAERALFALKDRPGTEDSTRGPAASELLKVVESHPGTSAAQRALLLAASDLFDEQKYPEAQARFEQFIVNYNNSPLAPIAALRIASCLDAQDKIDEAMSAYQRVINQFPAEPAAARARLHLAIIHEQKNQPEQALRLYDELNKPNVFGSVAAEAANRRERLLRKHPELVTATQPAPSQSSTASSAQGPGTTTQTNSNTASQKTAQAQQNAPTATNTPSTPTQPNTQAK